MTSTPVNNTPNPAAPAGSKNSLGAESVRDGRPATSDDVVEAMDEEGPGIADSDAEQSLHTRP